MLIAINHLRDIGAGATRPQIFICDHDGEKERWVLKLMGNVPAELAADWIGSFLALRVKVPCPDMEIAQVSLQALATAPPDVRQWALPGPAFASRELVESANEPDDLTVINYGSPDFLGRLYALDTWLEVLDRRKPEGTWNLLLSTADGSLCVIDFGKALTPCLHAILPLGSSGVVGPPCYPVDARARASKAAALATCDIIEAIDRTDLEAMVTSVPDAWIDRATRGKVLMFLLDRQRGVRSVCQSLTEGGAPWRN